MNYWIFKTEPGSYSIDDLAEEKVTEWWGIRNYQVRNLLRDEMKIGDKILFYHSSAKSIGIAGLAEVTSEAYPDTQQFKSTSPYFDTRSKKENPTWITRDIRFVKKFKKLIPLQQLKQEKELADMRLLQRGNRLSITPVTKIEYEHILNLAQ